MTPEEVLRPFLKRFELPDSLVRLLYLLLQREIEKDYPSFAASDDLPVRIAKGLLTLFSRLPPVRDKQDGAFTATIGDLIGLNESITHQLYFLSINRGFDPKKEQPYLARFWDTILSFNLSFSLPKRNRHLHLLGQSGTGKTSLIKKLAYMDMQTDASVIVMTVKGNLISTLARVPCDRSVWISDWSQVGLNLLDLDPSLLVWVFESLLDSEPTPRQKAFLFHCATQVKNLRDFRALLEKKPPDEFEGVPTSIRWRLNPLLDAYPVLERIFSRETNLDIREVMDSGKVLLLDTQTLGELGCSLVARYIVALISLSIKQRKTKRFVAVYLDEFPQYTTDHIAYMLDTAREANVGLHLAHQNLTQLNKFPALRASIHGSALKLVGQMQRR